jgi:hypothetical protein
MLKSLTPDNQRLTDTCFKNGHQKPKTTLLPHHELSPVSPHEAPFDYIDDNSVMRLKEERPKYGTTKSAPRKSNICKQYLSL